MKCPKCGGNGKYKTIFGQNIICDFCYGTGEIAYGEDDRIEPIGNKKPMTNEEWFCQLPTGEKAKFMGDIWGKGYLTSHFEGTLEFGKKQDMAYWEKWLKEKHDGSV